MKKSLLLFLVLIMSMIGTAQTNTKIQLRSTDKAECEQADYHSIKAKFSFSSIKTETIDNERGLFSCLDMPNTVMGGNIGEPQIPVVNELIAVPQGANPSIRVTHYSTTDYRLADYGIHRLFPRQPSLSKSQQADEVPFVMNEQAYQTRGLRSQPNTAIEVVGTMRGVRLGKMSVEPVSYDPVSNTIRVFNDIEVEVSFDGANPKATEDLLLKTYSPYFDIVYRQLFNGKSVKDAYDDHPDLYTTPVKMLVVTTAEYAQSEPFQTWMAWKKLKGIYVDVQLVTSQTYPDEVRNLIKAKYDSEPFTFLVIVGDETVVSNYTIYYHNGGSYNPYFSDNGYASLDDDCYHDVYMSRMSVSSTAELGNLVNKILTYEKYTMSDPSYLDESLIVAGWDSHWNPLIAKPTAQYANQHYFNSDHGITAHVYLDTESAGSDCYDDHLNHVGFVHYGGHGDIQEWVKPYFDNDDVDDLSNNDRYFWALGNCCLSANWGNDEYKPCLGEVMIRAANKGAFGYIGSLPESLWHEDYYFDVGAFQFRYDGAVQSPSSTSMGIFDALFDETGFNCLNSLQYIGNVAVTLAHYAGCVSNVDDEYYWRAYQCLGDGSVMPYVKQPAANNVSYGILYYGSTSFTVSADPGSYVSITCDGEILGVAAVPGNGTVDVPIKDNFPMDGTVTIVVTRAQRQPYINNIEVESGDLYIINASANPSNGGTVSGAGTYWNHTQCTLTATPKAPQFEFAYWMVNNMLISTDPVFTFAPNDYFDDAEFIACFRALTAHSLTCNTVSNGSISVDKVTAYKGETVTLSPTCDEYCFLTAWDVRDAGNNPIAVTDNQFIMPDSEVSISATFTRGNMIAVAFGINGEISVDQTCALPGTTINLTATLYEGYHLDEWVVYKTDEVNTSVTVTDNQFIMPDYDVTVGAIFSSTTTAELTLGSGTQTYEGDCVPTNIGSAYSLSQQIYTKGELGAAGKILSISFYYDSTNETLRYLDIYMSHTSESTITSWSNCSQDDLVYHDTHNFEQGWNTLTLQTPFEYDGVNNLLITVDDNTGSDLFDDHNFYTYYSDSQSICYYDFSDLSPFESTSYHATHLLHKAQMKVEKESSNHDSYISTSTFSLTGFNAVYGSVPSEPQGLTLVGANLTEIVTVYTPQGYEMSTSITGPYYSYLELTPTDGKLRQALYIRLRSEYYPDCYEGNLYFNYGSGDCSVFLSGTVTEGVGTLYTIDVEVNPEEGSVIGAGSYYENGNCILTAIPNKHFVFSGWQRDGDIVSVEPRACFTVTGDATYTAVFVDEPKYDVIITQAEGYQITADVTKAFAKDTVTLSGDKELGYFFQSWTVVDANGQSIEVTDNQFVMPKSNVTVSANIIRGSIVTILESPNGHITASKADGLPGDLVELETTPDANCFLDSWYVYKTGEPSTVVSIENNQFLLPAYDVTVMAVFKSTSVEDVAIGEGDDTNSLIPIKAYFPYSMSQQIYTAEEVGTAGSISAVAFKVTNGKAVSRNIDIYMRNTTMPSFAYGDTGWEIMSDLFKVFSGTVDFSASDWTSIEFSTPFEYDGVSNINLCVVDNTGTTTEDYPEFLVVFDPDSDFMAMQAYSLTNPFNICNPNTVSEYLGGRI
ncbi:MAG: hypothetical protein K6A28_06080, partial [Bacteroidales bacterium]|nr:hypothetical protein [Bacteroidales bacterium]